MSANLSESTRTCPVVDSPERAALDDLVVTYHYVRERDSDGVTGLTSKAFAEQIKAIKKRYHIVTADEFQARRPDTQAFALITFDDAVQDQFLAASILDDLGLPGVFFAPMRPYSDETDRWCAQHLLHALAEHLGWRELEGHVEPHISDTVIDETRMNALYHYEAPHKRRLKYALAFAVSPQQAWEILRHVNSSFDLSADDWYLSRDQLMQIQDAGHTLGGHGFNHVPYTVLTPREQEADMRRSVQSMNDLFGEQPRPLAYPFGRFDSTTQSLARSFGYTMTFSTTDRVDAKFLMAELDRREKGR